MRHIEVAPEQIIYCGTIDMAFSSVEPGIDLYAVAAADAYVGFFKIDLKYPDTQTFTRAGDLGLRAFMIDRWRQGTGLGSATLRALPRFLRHSYPDAKALVLTVNIRNQIAVRRYLDTGFQLTGDIHDGGHAGPQYVMRQRIA
ncbi:GNAT family N-acetyltransferase [Phaeobacter sp. B1627]|uniref:GNAT family N-acetyltransferase n=1 Tax=Phaeobacter sp. B1627 TaxID=2583809 RepID=UPI0021075D9A|nr:GNAT family N-acetyltransferase [Phaeobacter sp. B1627]